MKILVFISLVFALLLGCSKPSPDTSAGSATSEKAQYAKEDGDDFAAGKEAKAWMADPNHVFFKVSKETVTRLVTDLYSSGAAEVRISGLDQVEEMGNKEFGGSLVVKLPDEPAKRKTVFAQFSKIWEEAGDDATKDEGQQYVSLMLD